MHSTNPAAIAAAPVRRGAIYQAIWRWHFWAGLLCLAFVVLLAVTGSIYLFEDEINQSVVAFRNEAAAGSTPSTPSALLQQPVAAVPGATPVSFTASASPTASAVATLRHAAEKILVFLDRYTGWVLEMVPFTHEFMLVVKKLHSLEYFGTFANGVIGSASLSSWCCSACCSR